MKKRALGARSGFEIPQANIGGMRLPGDIDEAAALIRHAIDSGMIYIDTSRGYENSELKFAKALKGGYRKKVILSTKWSPWAMRIDQSDNTSADCMRRRIEEQMKRLEVDYLDFYQIWSINSRDDYKKAVARNGMLAGIRKAMDEGLVRHVGFTTHDDPESVMSYLDEVDWCEVILFTYNMLHTRYAPAIAAAHERGIGTLIMNPLGGGKLAEASPMLMTLARKVGAASVPELAIRFVLGNPNIDSIVSGISMRSDVDSTIAATEKGGFARDEMKTIQTFLDRMSREAEAFCTGCKYCMPCPSGVDIPEVMSSIYDDRIWGLSEAALKHYKRINGKASACEACGECEPKCTQKLPIMKEMAHAHMRFETGARKGRLRSRK